MPESFFPLFRCPRQYKSSPASPKEGLAPFGIKQDYLLLSATMAQASRTASDSSARARARYFRVLGDPTRLGILEALLEGERTVSELMRIVQAPQSRVSNHLACLKWCGFAASERRGREVVYRVGDPRVRDVLALSSQLSEDHCDHLASCSRIGPDWI
jgi:ArsR family transcriptional regulator, cadmium/lead-responsive transcriptional repressor